MTTKKANTDPTFPAPPANAPVSGEPPPVASAPDQEPIDEILDDLGKPAPDRAYHAPKPPPARAEHNTEPDEPVIVRQQTQPGIGDGLNVTPEERARLDAMMKAHARKRAGEEQEYLAPGSRQADTDPRHVHNKPPPVTTETGRNAPSKSVLPAAAAIIAVALVLVFVIVRATSNSAATSTAASTTTSTATTTTTATTAPTGTTAPTVAETAAPLPTIATTSVESLPTATAASAAHPVATGRPAHSAGTASSSPTTHAASTATAAAPTSTQPPPPGMNLLPDDPHK